MSGGSRGKAETNDQVIDRDWADHDWRGRPRLRAQTELTAGRAVRTRESEPSDHWQDWRGKGRDLNHVAACTCPASRATATTPTSSATSCTASRTPSCATGPSPTCTTATNVQASGPKHEVG